MRFRADPAKVRVAIRQHGSLWIATVSGYSVDRRRGYVLSGHSSDPHTAIVQALTSAERCGVDGIDIDMEWAYPHPYQQAHLR